MRMCFLAFVLFFLVTCQDDFVHRWIGGSIDYYSTSNYKGICGIFDTYQDYSAANWPGSRSNAGKKIRSDVYGDNHGFFLFSGMGWGERESDNDGVLQDLWEYSMDQKQWKWWSGSKFVRTPASSGVLANYDSGNMPGGRWGATIDHDFYSGDELIAFGGIGYAVNDASSYKMLNDMWKFDFGSTNYWKKIAGSNDPDQIGVYPAPRTAGGAPGGRKGSSLYYNYFDQELYLFGGRGCDSVSCDWNNLRGWMNDIWRFDFTGVDAGKWTYLSGDTTWDNNGTLPVPGMEGGTSSVIFPAARENAMTWAWGSVTNSFAVFGGETTTEKIGMSFHRKFLNDLWFFSLINEMWACAINDQTEYVNVYTSYDEGKIGSMTEAGVFVDWSQNPCDIYLFGGVGMGESYQQHFNDLWKFDLTSKEWSVIFRESGDPDWGTMNVWDEMNVISHRMQPVLLKDDANEELTKFYVFGGHQYGGSANYFYNDLWESRKIAVCEGLPETDDLVCNNRSGECLPLNDTHAECSCISGFEGPNCDICRCDGVYSYDGLVCSENGDCLCTNKNGAEDNKGVCNCDSVVGTWGSEKYQGSNCELSVCNGVPSTWGQVCNDGKGECVDMVCVCDDPHFGGVWCDENTVTDTESDVDPSDDETTGPGVQGGGSAGSTAIIAIGIVCGVIFVILVIVTLIIGVIITIASGQRRKQMRLDGVHLGQRKKGPAGAQLVGAQTVGDTTDFTQSEDFKAMHQQQPINSGNVSVQQTGMEMKNYEVTVPEFGEPTY